MKLLIPFLALLLALVGVGLFVNSLAGAITLSEMWTNGTTPSANLTDVVWDVASTNIFDGDLTTSAIGYNATVQFNFTKLNDSTSASVITMKYNDSTGTVTTNYTIEDTIGCWSGWQGHNNITMVRVESNKSINRTVDIFNESITPLKGVNVSFQNGRTFSIVLFNKTNLAVINSANYSTDYINGNVTFTTNYANNSEVYVNYTYNDYSTPTNAIFCHNSTEWQRMAIHNGSAYVYDAFMYWYIPSRDINSVFTLNSPSAYATRTNAVVEFNWTFNDTLADANHTLANCSVFTRLDNTWNYTANTTYMWNRSDGAVNTSITFDDGDRVWWKIGCKDAHGRDMGNSTVRIIDIDTDYYTLSLGANKVINFTLATGNAVFKGRVTSQSLTANGSAGLTGNYSIGGCTHRYVHGLLAETNCTGI